MGNSLFTIAHSYQKACSRITLTTLTNLSTIDDLPQCANSLNRMEKTNKQAYHRFYGLNVMQKIVNTYNKKINQNVTIIVIGVKQNH